MVDGLGYDWWIREWRQQNPAGRPKILSIQRTKGIHIYGLELRNAGQWFMDIKDVDDVHIHDMKIETIIFKQRGSMLRGQNIDLGLPEDATKFEKALFDIVMVVLEK